MVTASRSLGYECGEERLAGEELGLRVRRGAGERQSERGEPERRGREARVTSEGSGESGRIGRLIYRTPRPPGDPTAHAPPPRSDGCEPCLPRATRWNGPCLGRHYGPTFQPRHGHNYGPGQARARARPSRTGLGPCFFAPGPCQLVSRGPFGNLYLETMFS